MRVEGEGEKNYPKWSISIWLLNDCLHESGFSLKKDEKW
jgi:hypothetical protein